MDKKTIYFVRDYVYDDNMAYCRAFDNRAEALDFANARIKEWLNMYHVSDDDLQEMIKDGDIEREEGGDFIRNDTGRVQIYEMELWGETITIYS